MPSFQFYFLTNLILLLLGADSKARILVPQVYLAIIPRNANKGVGKGDKE